MSGIYSQTKAFHFPEKIKDLQQGRISAPIHVRIKPVNACNHRCWFCAYRLPDLQLGSDMDLKDRLSFEKLEEITHDCIEMGVRAVTFSGGGEPLIFPKLEKIIERLGQNQIRMGALTNGSKLQGPLAERFAQYGTWIRISMDYWDQTSMKNSRGVPPGAYDAILKNISDFASMKSACELGVSFIVTRENVSHLESASRAIRDAGARHIKFTACVISNDVHENNRYHEPFHAEALHAIRTTQKKFDSKDFRVINHYHLLGDRFEKHYQSCPYLSLLTVIGADSRVYTCQDKAYAPEGLLGSIQDRSFKEFWFSEENARAIHSFDPSVKCKHHCVTHSKNSALIDFLKADSGHVAFV